MATTIFFPSNILIFSYLMAFINTTPSVDPIRHIIKPKLEPIDEQPENNKNSEVKIFKSSADIKRLCGGSMEKRKIHNSDSVERQDSSQCVQNPELPSSTSPNVVNEIRGQKRECSMAEPLFTRNCERLEYLEEQMEKIHLELHSLRKNMVPPEDIEKFGVLSQRLNEINRLLIELKFNYSHLPHASPKEKSISFTGTKNVNLGAQQPLHTFQQSQHLKKWHDYGLHRYFEPFKTKSLRIRETRDVSVGYGEPTSAEVCVRQTPIIRPQQCIPHTAYQKYNMAPPSFSASNQKQYPQMVKCGRLKMDSFTQNECELQERDSCIAIDCCSLSTGSMECLPPTPAHGPMTPYKKEGQIHPNQVQPSSQSELHQPRCQKPTHPLPLAYKDSGRNKCSSNNVRYSKAPVHAKYPACKRDLQTSNASSHIGRMPEPIEVHKNQKYLTRNSADKNLNLTTTCSLSSSEMDKTAYSNKSLSYIHTELPLITKHLPEIILDIIGTIDHRSIALTVILQPSDVYHINISVTHSGQSLGDVYTTERALKQAERKHLFNQFLTFFVLNSNNTLEQKNRILGHSFEFINMDDCQTEFIPRSAGHRMTDKSDASNHSQAPTHVSHLSSQNGNAGEEADKPIKGKSKAIHRDQHFHFISDIHDDSKNRLKAGKGNEDRPQFSNTIRQWINAYQSPRNKTLDKIERIQSLEQQVTSLHEDLNGIREKLVPPEDLVKLSQLSQRLKELFELLGVLWTNYKRLLRSVGDIKPRPSNALEKDRGVLSSKGDNKLEPEDAKDAETSAKCQKFFNEINNQPTLLEKHLLTMKDFRTDAELRRQRLAKKRQEKMLQKQEKPLEADKVENDTIENDLGKTKAPETSDAANAATWQNRDRQDLAQSPKLCKTNQGRESQSEPQQGKYKTLKSDTTFISPTPTKPDEILGQQHAKNIVLSHPSDLPYSGNKIQTSIKETQTDFDFNISSRTKMFPSYAVNTVAHKISRETQSERHFSVTQTPDEQNFLPLIRLNLRNTINNILGNIPHSSVLLTVVSESDQLFHINISTADLGKSLASVYATERALEQAQDQHLFDHFLTFFVMNAENTWEQKYRMLGHSFEIIKNLK